MYLCYKWP